jgi:hypothetical protein
MSTNKDTINLTNIYSTLNEGWSDDPPFRKAIDEFCNKLAGVYRTPETENKEQVLELYQLIRLWESVYLIKTSGTGSKGSPEARGALDRFHKAVAAG